MGRTSLFDDEFRTVIVPDPKALWAQMSPNLEWRPERQPGQCTYEEFYKEAVTGASHGLARSGTRSLVLLKAARSNARVSSFTVENTGARN